MSTEARSIQDVIMSSLKAEESGVIIEWKQTCLQVVNAAQASHQEQATEISILQDELDGLKLKFSDVAPEDE